MSASELKTLLIKHWPELNSAQIDSLGHYYDLVLAENTVQNLTKLTSPEEFFWGHLWDVRELIQLNWGFEGTSLDLGSGAGIPGIPIALVTGSRWVITDSEGRKAGFIRRAVETLRLEGSVTVFAGRAEDLLRGGRRVDRVVSRAVGKIEKIYGWLRPCSTWNTLILMKGPAWEQEWADFLASKHKRELALQLKHDYSVPGTGHTRALIHLTRQ